MITTAVLFIVFAIMDMFDAMLSGFTFIKSASSVFNTMFLYIDALVYFVRSLLPLTFTAFFNIIYQIFMIWFVLWFLRWIMSTIPLFGSKNN